MASTPGASVLVVFILIGFNWTGNFVNPSNSGDKLDLINEIKANVARAMGPDLNNSSTDEKSRLRRNILLSTNNLSNQNTAEGLLSTCQLTNLLLYQLINQKFGPTGNTILNSPLQPQILPFQGLGAGVLLGQNSFNAPILQTFLSTSTVLSETMTTSIATVTLMFGNQKSTAVITNTKSYNITSTQIITLTSTIQPTQTSSAEIEPSATRPPTEANSNLDYDDDFRGGRYGKDRRQTAFTSTPVLEAVKPSRTSKRRKFRTKQEAEAEFAQERLNAEQAVGVVQENKYGYQKDRPSFLFRRPKRLDNYETVSSELEYENSDPSPLEKDHLLEPSYDGVSQDGEAAENNPCPKPSEITVTYTKTVTKFVNSPSSIKFNTGDFRIDDVVNNPVVNQIKSAPPVTENFNNKERRVFRPKPRNESPTEEVSESINEERYPAKRFRYGSTTTEGPPTRSSNRLGNFRASFGPGTSSAAAAKEPSRPSSKFIRSRGSSTFSTPKPEISGNDQIGTSNRRRSSSRFRGSSTTTERSDFGYTSRPRSSSRFKSKSSRNSAYEYVETTTRSSSRFKSKNRSGRNQEPTVASTVVADTAADIVDSDPPAPAVDYETYAGKYSKLKSRFSPTTSDASTAVEVETADIIDGEPPVVEYDTYERKYNKLKNRFSPTTLS